MKLTLVILFALASIATATDIHDIVKKVKEEMEKEDKAGLISKITSHSAETMGMMQQASDLAKKEGLDVNVEFYATMNGYLVPGTQYLLDEAEKMNSSDCLTILQGTYVRVVAKTRKAREEKEERDKSGPPRATDSLEEIKENYTTQKMKFLNLLKWITDELLKKTGTSLWWGYVHQAMLAFSTELLENTEAKIELIKDLDTEKRSYMLLTLDVISIVEGVAIPETWYKN